MYLAGESRADMVYVFGSYAGADVDPSWFRNVVAHPDDVRVEIGNETHSATAEVLTELRRSEIYAAQAMHFSQFAEYEAKAARTIPVVALHLR